MLYGIADGRYPQQMISQHNPTMLHNNRILHLCITWIYITITVLSNTTLHFSATTSAFNIATTPVFYDKWVCSGLGCEIVGVGVWPFCGTVLHGLSHTVGLLKLEELLPVITYSRWQWNIDRLFYVFAKRLPWILQTNRSLTCCFIKVDVYTLRYGDKLTIIVAYCDGINNRKYRALPSVTLQTTQISNDRHIDVIVVDILAYYSLDP